MSDADDIESIRERKAEQLKQSLTAPDEPVHVEGADHFEELTSDGVVLVDFYADWCGPCQMLEPVVEDVAAETVATVAKVDVDEHQSLAGQFGVQGVPTLFLYVDGERAERMVGAQDADRLRSLVESYV
ncbi:thioredoxin [Halomicrobium salinisoli]|uniref:thioredoxin n=1 Tax=Halomicrobium salinisoli TaxID=2878391 RepID=UPI001CF0BE34|nr:thioredoxin [Halomicrobium salinisoli]